MTDVKSSLLDKIIKYGYKYELNKSPVYLTKFNQYVDKYDSFILSGGGKEFDKMKADMLSALTTLKNSITEHNYSAELKTVVEDLEKKCKELIIKDSKFIPLPKKFIPLSKSQEAKKVLEGINGYIERCEIISNMPLKEKGSYNELLAIQTGVVKFRDKLITLRNEIDGYEKEMPAEERKKIQEKYDQYLKENQIAACVRLSENKYEDDNVFQTDAHLVFDLKPASDPSAYTTAFSNYFQTVGPLPDAKEIHAVYCPK